MTPRFLPSARTFNWLIAVGLLVLGYALYLRYLVIEQSTVGQACDAGLNTWQCSIRKITTILFNHMAFGRVALTASLMNLVRPSLTLFVIALVAIDFGIVLYNVGLSALAAALLIMSFARPARPVIAPE